MEDRLNQLINKEMKINSSEIEIRGNWVFNGKTMQTDNTTKRIDKLIKGYLVEISIAENGWEKLFQDPKDNRYWELTYPKSEIQGGGPPLLRSISIIEVQKKYFNIDNTKTIADLQSVTIQNRDKSL